MKAYVFSENQTRAVEIEEDTSLAKEEFEFFDDQTVRKVWHIDEEEWYFAIYDIVAVLTDSSDLKQYIKKMRTRDKELNSKWGTICTPLPMIAQDGKMRRIQASNTELALNLLAEVSTTEISRTRQPKGMAQSKEVVLSGGKIAGNARRELEEELGRSVISSSNATDPEELDDTTSSNSDNSGKI